MPRLDRQHLRRALLLGAAVLATTLSCGREVTGPPGGLQLVRGFTFDARFGPEGLPSGVASDLVPFTRVRVVLVSSTGATVVDRVVDFPSDQEEVTLSLDVPLTTGTATTGEVMSLTLAYVNAAGDTVFRGGPQQVTVIQSSPGSPPPPVPQIPVTFTGTGAAATRVVISPVANTVVAGDAFAYTAVALDGQGSPIAGTPIAWRSATPTRATITAPGAGAGTTLASRGTAVIIAQLLSGPADTVSLEVLPRAQGLVVVSGGGQSALVGAAVPAPVVVRVNATDGLPIAGVTVNFAAANGGSVGTASAVSDVNGLVQTTWTLGPGVGAQSLTATSTGLAGSPLAINATATAPVVQLIHHYPFTGDVSDIVGTANGTTVGSGVALTGGVLALNGTDGYVQFASRIVPSTGSYSVSMFVRNRSTTSLTTYLSQGVSTGPGFFIGHNASGVLLATEVWYNTSEPAPAANGLFSHVVLVVDSIANQSRLYVNGTLRQTTSQSIATSPTGNDTRLGRQFDPFGEFMDGDIDELRIYSGAIDGAQVAALHAAGVSAPSRLVFGTQPSNVAAGAVISPAVVVRVEDALGRIRTAFNGPVTIALDLNPGGATLGGTLTVDAVGGIATFADLSLGAVATGYRFSATADGAPAVSSGLFDVLSGAVTQLDVTQQPTTAVAGVPFTPALVVTARDGGGNVATGFTGAVTVAVWNGNGAIGGDVVVSAVAGVATFSNVWARATNTELRLRATATGLTPDTTVGFPVAPGTPYQLRFAQQPSAALSGQPIAPAVTVYAVDPFENTTPAFAGAVTVAIGNNVGSATLGGTLTVNPVGGVATFSDLTLSAPGSGYTLTAGSPAMVGGTSAAFTVTSNVLVNSWTNAAGGTWSTATNWSLGRAPIASDTVVIALAGTYTVTMDTPFTGGFITVGGATGTQTLAITSQTLTVNNELRTLGTGEVRVVSATVGGAGAVANGGTLYLRGATIGVPVTNTDSMVVQQASSIAGALTTVAGSSLRLVGDASVGGGSLTVANGFTNRGTMDLAGSGYTMSLVVTAGTLVNAPEGTITTTGASGTHVITAVLDNQGTMSLGDGLILDLPSAAHLNSGTVTLSGGGMTLTQTGTAPSFTNTGTISLGTGRTWNVTGGTLTQAGSIGGTGTLALSAGVTLALPTDYTATVRLALFGATVTGPGVLTNGRWMYLRESVIDAPFINADTLVVQQTNTITGALTTVAGSTLRLVGDASLGGGSLTVANGFTNRGTIVLAGSGYTMTLGVTAGTLVNAAEGIIATTSGSGAHVISGVLDNQGTMSLGQGLVLDRPNAAHLNSGTIVLGGGDVNVTGTNPSFSNTGIVSIDVGRTWNVSGGTLTQAGSFDGAGTLALSAATLSIPTGFVTTTLRLSLIGSTVEGPGLLTSGGPVYLRGSGVNAPFTIADSAVAQQANTITGALTTAAGSTLRLVGDASLGGGSLTVANGFTNSGTIELGGFNYDMTLTVTTGTLVNAPGGIITTASNSGVHTIAAAVDNQGTVRMVPGGAGALGITGSFTQSGTLEVDIGGLTAGAQHDRLTVSGTATLGGTLNAAYFGGFTASPGSTFSVLTAGAVSGTFATVSLPALMQPAPIYDATSVTLNGLVSVQGIRWVSATSGNWSTPTAWDLGRAPIATDSVVIDVAGTYTVTMDVNFTGTYVVVGGGAGVQTLAAGVRTLSLSSGLTVFPTGEVTLGAGGNLAGAGGVTNVGTVTMSSGTLSAGLVNDGRLVLLGNATVNGPVTTGPTSVIEVRGAATTGGANATITTGFTNTGAIELTDVGAGYGASLTVTTGPLVNAATGTITALVGGGGGRTLAASLLDNFGTLSADFGLTANTAIDQRGIATVAAGRTLAVSGLLRLFTGSTTTVNGTLTRTGGCTNAGGTIVGSGTYAACP